MMMNTKDAALWISLFGIALFAAPAVAQTANKADVVAAITTLENQAVKADLAGDTRFYQNVMTEDWTRRDSDGSFYTKAQLIKFMYSNKIRTCSERLSELYVRAYA